MLLEEREHLGADVLLVPASVPELDQHLVLAHLFSGPREVVERELLVDDVGRELEEDSAELARRAQRLECLAEAPEDLAAKLPRRAIDPAALVDRRLVAEVGRELLLLHGMAGHHAERLHVHHEVVRGLVGPARRHRLGRKPVVGRVELDRVELLGVVCEALAGG